jgi:multidrug efflux pump subunit AcrA (membrane-fusion protein)
LLVPANAIVRSNDETTVVLDTAEHSAKIVRVKVLGRHADLVAVDGGIQAGDRVITDGGYNLPEGAHVDEAAEPRTPGEK